MSAISKLEIVLASEPSVTLVAIANLFAVTAQTAEKIIAGEKGNATPT